MKYEIHYDTYMRIGTCKIPRLVIGNRFQKVHPFLCLSPGPAFQYHLPAIGDDMQTIAHTRAVYTRGHIEALVE